MGMGSILSVIYTESGLYQKIPYDSENELEEVIQKVKLELFGQNRIYLNIKKKIGTKGFQENIPDGYLIDLSCNTPRLYFVENELIDHDAIRHIAMQILGFSIAFKSEPQKVRKILFNELHTNPILKEKCDEYIAANAYRNFDHFLDCLIAHPFSVLIIIDDENIKLENAIIPQLKFNVDVIHLMQYRNSNNNYFYHFEPFMQDIIENNNGFTQTQNINPHIIDTIVVPAREKGFQEVFMDENRWYEINIGSLMREAIKYIAVYRVAPISAITHIAEIKSFEPWGDRGKWVVNFSSGASEIKSIPLKKEGKIKAPQSHRYAVKSKLLAADSLDDIW